MSFADGYPLAFCVSQEGEKKIASTKENPATHVPLSIPSLFTPSEAFEQLDREQITRVPLSRIMPFPDHPFRVRDDDRMLELVESVSRNGVLHPALLLPNEDKDGYYYYIAGHRRGLACEKAGLSDIPAIIKDITLDEATIIMVDSNLQQREEILPSEKAWAYRMKLDAIKRNAGRPAKKSAQLGQNYDGKTSREQIAATSADSSGQIQRYIRLTYLLPELLDRVDERRMAFSPAVEISYLSIPDQESLLKIMEHDEVSPSLEQATALKRASQDGNLDYELIHMIMKQEKPNQHSLKLSSDTQRRVYAYFPKDATPKDIEDGIIEALELRKRQLAKKHQMTR